MKTKISKSDLLTRKCSYQPYLGCASNRALTLREILNVLPQKEPMMSRIQACRMMADREMEEGLDDTRSNRIKRSLPLWYPAGVFGGSYTKSDIKTFSGLMSLDIDSKDNADLGPDEIKDILSEFKFVFYAGYSARGWGVYCLIPIPEDGADDARFRGYFEAVKDIMQKNGLIVDSSCSNVNRGRFLSADDCPYIADTVEVWQTWKAPQVTPVSMFGDEPDERSREFKRMEALVSRLEDAGLDLFESQHDWFVCGRCLVSEFGEDGRQFFLRISKLWEKVHGWTQQQDPNRMYTYLLKGKRLCGLGFIYAKAKQAGIFVPRNDEDYDKSKHFVI